MDQISMINDFNFKKKKKMTHDEVVQEIIKHADIIARRFPYCLLEKSDAYYIDKTGNVGNKNNIYEINGSISRY